MTTVEMPDHPLNVVVTKTLTLPDVTSEQEALILEAAGADATVTIVDGIKQTLPHAGQADVILGLMPHRLLDAAPNLRWVHATASGVDMFMYEAFVNSDVMLTGEKGLMPGLVVMNARTWIISSV